jgi:hypothetical protein
MTWGARTACSPRRAWVAEELEEDETVSLRVILGDRLIRDGGSPVFWPCVESVESAMKHARAALHLG